MPVDPLAVATVGFQSAATPVSFALCIATEGYQCVPAPTPAPGGLVGNEVWCPPDEPSENLDTEVIARIVWDTVEEWNKEVRQTSMDLAMLVALKAFPGGDSLGTQYAAVVALVVEEDEDES